MGNCVKTVNVKHVYFKNLPGEHWGWINELEFISLIILIIFYDRKGIFC